MRPSEILAISRCVCATAQNRRPSSLSCCFPRNSTRSGWLGRERSQRDVLPELLEATDVMVFDACSVQLIEVVDAELYVRLACFQDVVDHDQQAVRHGDRGLVASSTSRDAVELCVKVRGALLDARPGDLAHNPPQPDVAGGSVGKR